MSLQISIGATSGRIRPAAFFNNGLTSDPPGDPGRFPSFWRPSHRDDRLPPGALYTPPGTARGHPVGPGKPTTSTGDNDMAILNEKYDTGRLGLSDDEQFLDIDGFLDFQCFSIDSQFHLISSSLSSAGRAARRVAAIGCGVFSLAPLRKKARGKPRSRHFCHAPHASRRLSLSNDLRRTVQSYNSNMFSKTLLTL